MNSLTYLISYLCEHFKGKKHSITPFQKQFNELDKVSNFRTLYFGYFNIDDVQLTNVFLDSIFSSNKNTPVFFTTLKYSQDTTNLNFIGWKVDFEFPYTSTLPFEVIGSSANSGSGYPCVSNKTGTIFYHQGGDYNSFDVIAGETFYLNFGGYVTNDNYFTLIQTGERSNVSFL